jgi:hypothetical protein
MLFQELPQHRDGTFLILTIHQFKVTLTDMFIIHFQCHQLFTTIGSIITKHQQAVQHVLYDGQDWFQLSFLQSMATGWAVSVAMQPCFDADFTEDVPTRALHGSVQHALTDTAHQVWVRGAIKLLHIKARHVCKRVLKNKNISHFKDAFKLVLSCAGMYFNMGIKPKMI